jgi:hypothetical protein
MKRKIGIAFKLILAALLMVVVVALFCILTVANAVRVTAAFIIDTINFMME